MARNRIQSQKGLSDARFVALYGEEEQCRTMAAAWRLPEGFVCPKCGGRAHCIVGPRKLYQCNACQRQTSVTAGTIFNSTKAPLTTWFRAMHLITQTKQGISSIELGRRLGTTQTTAWKIKTKLAEVKRAIDREAAAPEGYHRLSASSQRLSHYLRGGAAMTTLEHDSITTLPYYISIGLSATADLSPLVPRHWISSIRFYSCIRSGN